jgi:hypothetical protein
MVVRVLEYGTRPSVMTRARLNAPQAARAFGQLFEQRNFADMATVVLDWSNSLGQQPEEVAKPVLHLIVVKLYPGTEKALTVTSRIDVDDVFSQPDVMTRSLMEDLIQELATKIVSEEARKENAWTRRS